jgi:hypothetical protein
MKDGKRLVWGWKKKDGRPVDDNGGRLVNQAYYNWDGRFWYKDGPWMKES